MSLFNKNYSNSQNKTVLLDIYRWLWITYLLEQDRQITSLSSRFSHSTKSLTSIIFNFYNPLPLPSSVKSLTSIFLF